MKEGITVSTGRPRVRRALRIARWSALASAAVTALAACGSSAGAAPGATGSSASYPTQDVVSSVAVDPALRAELPDELRNGGTVTLGTTIRPGTANLPYGGTAPSGQEMGLNVDIRDAVGKLLGVTWNVQNGTFATIIPGVQNHKYDVGEDNFGVTAAREKVVDFATYLSDGQSLLGRDDIGLNTVRALTDLCGLTVATNPGSTFQQILTDGAGKCAAAGKKPYTVQLFSDDAPIWLGLANGKVDVMFGPTLGVKYDVVHRPNVKFLGQFSSTPVGFVAAKGSPLVKAISDAVNELIRDGEYARILAKWGVTGSGIASSAVNPPSTL